MLKRNASIEEVIRYNESKLMDENYSPVNITMYARPENRDGELVLNPYFSTEIEKILKKLGFEDQKYFLISVFQKEVVNNAVRLNSQRVFRFVFEDDSVLYEHLEEAFDSGAYTESGMYKTRRGDEYAKLKLNMKVFGIMLGITFPDHYLVDDEGEIQKSTFFRNGDYVNEPTILNTRTFFFIPGENRVNIVSSYYRRWVEPFLVQDNED